MGSGCERSQWGDVERDSESAGCVHVGRIDSSGVALRIASVSFVLMMRLACFGCGVSSMGWRLVVKLCSKDAGFDHGRDVEVGLEACIGWRAASNSYG